jgi:hypothetical protein
LKASVNSTLREEGMKWTDRTSKLRKLLNGNARETSLMIASADCCEVVKAGAVSLKCVNLMAFQQRRKHLLYA